MTKSIIYYDKPKVNRLREAVQGAMKRYDRLAELKRVWDEVEDDKIRFYTDPFFQEHEEVEN